MREPAADMRTRRHEDAASSSVPSSSREVGRGAGARMWLVRLYRIRAARGVVQRLCMRLENTRFHSQTWREILRRHHGVDIGEYSYGACLRPGAMPPGTVVGRYCSFAARVHVYRRNHPVDRLSQHPFFYKPRLGLVQRDPLPAIEDNPLVVGHDVWIGDHAIVLPGCRTIGDGAVVGAGAVVTRDVPPFTVVGGNPARIIRKRYDDETERAVRRSQWWSLSHTALAPHAPAVASAPPSELVDALDALRADQDGGSS